MRKVKLHIDRPMPDSAEINAHRDFGKLMQQAKPNIYKRFGKYGLYSASLIVVLSSIFILNYAKQNKNIGNTSILINDSIAKRTAFINAPLASVNVPFEKFSINTIKDTVLTYSSGTKIKLLANTFPPLAGKPVEIRYREFRTPLDMIFSGIPMVYDSCGKTYQFESGGMFELLAFCDGRPVRINPGKQVEVALYSTSKEKNFNFYGLDTNKRNWTYLGKESKQKKQDFVYNYVDNQDAKLAYTNVEEQLKLHETMKPLAPESPDKKRYRFNIDFLPKEFPELAPYKNLQFEIVGSDKPYNREIYEKTWDEIKLVNEKKALYTLRLKSKTELRMFMVKPVFEGADMDSAMAVYDNAYKNYEKTLVDLSRRKNDMQLKYEAFKQKSTAQAHQMQLENNRIGKEEQTKKDMLLDYVKTYVVKTTGVYNCDAPLDLPKGISANVRYIASDQSPVNVKHAFLLSNDRNSCYNISGKKQIQFNPKKKNMIVIIDEQNRIGYVTKEALKQVQQNGQNYFLVIEYMHKDVSKPSEIAELINF